MSDGEGGDFVSVSDAAARLKIAPRQVRRYADRLKPEDIRRDTVGTGTGTSGGQSPLLVRFSAVAALRDEGKPQGQARDTTEDRDRDRVGTGGDNPASMREAPILLREIITRQDAEIANLRAALDKSQEATTAALAELQRANERATVLIAAVGTGRLQIEAQGKDGKGDSTATLLSKKDNWWARLTRFLKDN